MAPSDRRPKFRRGLSSLYIPTYDALCSLLGPQWQPYSGLRTFDEQTNLWNLGRSLPGGVVTNAKAGESAHNYGCATDWTWFEGDVLTWLKKEDPRWQEYLAAVTKSGLRPGSEWGDIDHNELKLTCDWPHVLIAFGQGGMTAAQEKIKESLA